ncbi:hypothetical protein LRS10_10830 [Phenylobacterium sp. J426]|uniref:hypothetical protein n=1 Tax=Phenylobacterium sp. J426 TaxID=2898439 RepID=UPI0021511719|nr:hypothetical protein [Phenylobacterium sp. J426]MCR5874618.1 hypothetical protein [Phenylobacterium sp. J426]
MVDTISISPEGLRWAVKHNGGVLGFAETEQEALGVARSLLGWLDEQGRLGELVTESRSWAPPGSQA